MQVLQYVTLAGGLTLLLNEKRLFKQIKFIKHTSFEISWELKLKFQKKKFYKNLKRKQIFNTET